MANTVVTMAARRKMVQARAGEIVLPEIVGFAFGDGGVDSGGNVLPVLDTQEVLKNELYRKLVDNHTFIGETTCRYECTLTESELAGESISEIALYDTEGDLVAIKNFKAKGKDGDLEMTFQIDDIF